MSSWNFGSSRLGGQDAGVLDLKALLNQVTSGGLGGSLGNSLGGLTAPLGGSSGGNRAVGGGGGNGGCLTRNAGGANGAPFGIIGTGMGGSGGLDSGSNSNNGTSQYDPFSSMSTFGFFNPKDPGGTMQMSNNGGERGSGGHHHNMNKSPTYHSSNSSHSPVFRNSSHSPINFYNSGGGSGRDSGSGGSQSNQFSSSSNNYANSNKGGFSIGTFSIDDTIPGRERENSSSSMFSDDISSSTNGHGGHYGNSSNNHFGSSSSNYRDRESGGDRSGGSYNNTSNNSTSNHHGNSNNRSNEHGENSFNQGVRETGIIEKLLHSYGFIQCCERQARLFFHFSQFDGTIEHLKLGDPVEFEMTYDRRTGKPIASAVTKIGPEVVLSEERVTGTVTTELHHESNGELQGRISYENRGECFFLPYCQEDIEGNVTLSVGDTVSFQIATNQRSGNLTARYVRLENPARPVRYKGIVSSLKDNFGFIERADVAKEIFFHFTETRITDGIVISDNVEFNIQTRNGKEVACTITKLPQGTVVFEDIGAEKLKGQILKPIDKSQCPSPTLGPTPRSESGEGRLRYRGPDRQELEVVYGEKDQRGAFTMRHGDWVEFQLAVDRRNKQQRATNVTLCEESFTVSGERREEGVISAINSDSGYITCAERDTKMFFRMSELLDFSRQPRIADDVEFTIIQDSTSPIRQSAIRIKYLAHGAVQFEIPVNQSLHGVVIREPSTAWVSQEALAGILPSLSNLGLPTNVAERLIQSLSSAEVLAQLTGATAASSSLPPNTDAPQGEPGVIQYLNPWTPETIIFHWKDCTNLRNIRIGTKVVFDIHQVRRNRDLVASNIRAEDGSSLMDSPPNIPSSNNMLSNYPTSMTNQINCVQQQQQQLNGQDRRPSPPLNMMNSLSDSGSIPDLSSLNQQSHPQQHCQQNENSFNNGPLSSYNSNTSMNNTTPVNIMGSPRTTSNTYSGRDMMEPNVVACASGFNDDSFAQCQQYHLDQQHSQSNGLYGSCASSVEELALNEPINSSSSSSNQNEVNKGCGSPSGEEKRDIYSNYEDRVSPPQSTSGSSSGGSSSNKNPRVVMKGYIAALKEGFGFIETMAQDGEIFFHQTSLVGDFGGLEVGQEVEYVVSSKASQNGKNAADIVKPLPKGSIGRAAVFPDILQGVVVRPLRGANPDQTEYTGLIDGQDGQAYPFGIISMLNKKELLQAGEGVEFQLDAQGKPVNIRAMRKKLRAAVEAVKGQYGFLSYELEDGKKLFFHMSEVKDHQHLNPGDEVEFVILQNPRNGKSSACSVVKVGGTKTTFDCRESQRPERLLNRLSKLSVDESAPRLVVVRQPYGPDGTKGFCQPRASRQPGCLASSRESTGSVGSN